MTDTLTLTGLVATTPRHLVTSEGLPITSFRLASTQRRYDRGAAKWIDGDAKDEITHTVGEDKFRKNCWSERHAQKLLIESVFPNRA